MSTTGTTATELEDLAAEGDALDAIVSRPDVSFDLATAAEGWTIGHQIAHLHWTDRVATLACNDPDLFAEQRESFLANPSVTTDAAAESESRLPKEELLDAWRAGRADVLEAFSSKGLETRVNWLGPPMTVASMAISRIMETWAHGVDITGALGLPPSATARLYWVADLGVRTRNFSYRNRGLTPPTEHFRIELTGPENQQWVWGPADAQNRVAGSALAFCELVSQRRHAGDPGLTFSGADAVEWSQIAQVFAGPGGVGRQPAGA